MTGAAARELKYRNLLDALRSLGRVAVAFSGGLDSALLLHAARQALGDEVLAATVATTYMPQDELLEAEVLARTMGARHLFENVGFPEVIRDNPPDRCLLCKRVLFGKLLEMALREGVVHLLDGTNLDDLNDHRPGLAALRELGVKSPLLDGGLAKADIREISRDHGLPTWNKPAGACLLTRIPHGVRVEEAELRRIDRAERFLKVLGFAAVRVRSHGDLARIEAPRDRLAELVAADRKHGIEVELKRLGYRHVTLDLAGYRMGSLNEPAR